ncbi:MULTISPECIES: PTS sugar transporter subunit IIA [Actinomycetaceae]|uniref:PTS sugar transporter subunit IIA n=1 Tax=Actinomycetaceae TaxID=2049 RepID=UPI00254A66B4|nr:MULTISPECIES: PTS glucose transporter subunit IIA [unclassified Pauljensenia]MDK6400177.1 PTS glucose transporter subunit IIA [Pauljensenia sp. UMB9872]MDK7172729.1 PTS glucose transporter subunit IIA [Pauljensenia sp. UMB1235]
MTFTIYAPLSGTVEALSAVPDPVFSQEIIGPGFAIVPEGEGAGATIDVADVGASTGDAGASADSLSIANAPISGTVHSLHPHAFAIKHRSDTGILVHLGIDTVNLKGEGFTVHASQGDAVKAGSPLITWDRSIARHAGLAVIVPVIALRPDVSMKLLVKPGTFVRAGVAIATCWEL